MNATHTSAELLEPVVIPDSVDQCFELLGHDNLFGLGDFAREAGFEETVLITPDTLRGMLGEAVLDGPPSELVHAVTDVLRELRNAMKRYPGTKSHVVRERTGRGSVVGLLVRQNLSSSQPFTLVTLR